MTKNEQFNADITDCDADIFAAVAAIFEEETPVKNDIRLSYYRFYHNDKIVQIGGSSYANAKQHFESLIA